ncbi:MAG: hypothetical protein Q9183_003873, partial [Haloplaca sp. 2 TL-2023]
MGPPSDATQAMRVLIFGPQCLSLQDHSFSHLRSAIRSNRDNDWMRKVIEELPRHVELFSSKIQRRLPSSALELLRKLGDWVDFDTPLPEPTKIPNTVLTPLVVLDQLAQYTQYVEIAHVEAGLGTDCWSLQPQRSATLGFCTGILSALVVSSASSKADFQTYGAVAVRLAALIGLVVDANDGESAKALSFSTAWNSPEQGETLRAMVADKSSDAYFSVHYDMTRATITTSLQSSPTLQQRLREHGIVASEIALQGRYHSNSYEDQIDDLVALCDSSPELQLPDASKLVIPTSSTSSGELITAGKLHHIALRDILLEPCEWQLTVENVVKSSLDDRDSLLVVFGQEKCVPPTILRHINEKVVYMANQEDRTSKLAFPSSPKDSYSDDDIAVVGMASK